MTNDPNHPKETLQCRGKILEPVHIKPRRINFGKVHYSSGEQSKKVVLTRGDGGPLQLELKPLASKDFEIQLWEVKPGEKYELEATLKPPFSSKRLWGSVNLDTGIPEAPLATVPIYATVVPRVSPRPAFIGVPGEPLENWRQTLELVWSDSPAFKMLGAKADDPALAVKIGNSRGKQQLIVEAVPGSWPTRGSHLITIETDDPMSPSVTVPVNVGDIAKRPKRRPAPATKKAAGVKATSAAKPAPAKPAPAKPKPEKAPTTP
jgi:hypothetical protein